LLYAWNLLEFGLPWQVRALEKYEQELLKWNDKVNLTSAHRIKYG
jgi:16S rRNA G527 N7-methylase RsmG